MTEKCVMVGGSIASNKNLKTKSINIPSRELTYPPKMTYLKMIFLFLRWEKEEFPGGY